jgi:K+-transporting ATPase KdpF subunit
MAVMPLLYVVGGVVSLALVVYLFVALLKPEAF